MQFVNNPEVEELKRRVATQPQSVVARDIGLSEAMLSYVLRGERRLKDEAALKKLGFVTICATVRAEQAPKIRKAIKEILA